MAINISDDAKWNLVKYQMQLWVGHKHLDMLSLNISNIMENKN